MMLFDAFILLENTIYADRENWNFKIAYVIT